MVESSDDLRLAPIKAEETLAFNWRNLIALGVSLEEARSIATALIAKRLLFIYYHRLTKAGVAIDNAHKIARAVAKYDMMEILPTLEQQALIQQHCPEVCRSGLWRADLLLRYRS